jgi:hypothetical protein
MPCYNDNARGEEPQGKQQQAIIEGRSQTAEESDTLKFGGHERVQ